MIDTKELLFSLSEIMSISGTESRSADAVRALIGPYFDTCETDAIGNHLFTRRAPDENAPTMLIDTHYDEIGMVVTGILDGGFLTVTNVGGVDTRILPAADVMIYGKETIPGVIGATPPHLSRPEDRGVLPTMESLLVDTGYPKEELETIVSVGDRVGFRFSRTELLGDGIAGRAFDDKSCVAAAVAGVALCPRERQAFHVVLSVSAMEETSLIGGAPVAAFAVEPDLALVIDVGFANTPGIDKEATLKFGGGPGISISAATDRKLTRRLMALAGDREIPFTAVAEPGATGTNADAIALTGAGIPTAGIALPLKSMHTYTEVVSVRDMEETARLVAAALETRSLLGTNA